MDSVPRTRSLRRLYSAQGASSTRSLLANNVDHFQPQQHHQASSAKPLHPSLVNSSARSSKGKGSGQSLADAAAQAEWAGKRWMWCPDPVAGYVAGYIVNEQQLDDGSIRATVSCVDDKTRTINIDELSKMNPPKFDRVQDIADLTFLNEASVVHNLRERYTAEMIYTYSGPFLVAVNPYRPLPIYGDDAVQLYKSRRREDCPPHVFAVAERAWQNMIGEREGQSILITGESGAGKTENTKKVIQYLTAIAAEAAHALPVSGSASSFEDSDPVTYANTRNNAQGSQPIDVKGKGRDIAASANADAQTGRELENQIIQANPILEAFGNAQTVRNNNSSRFGKFVRIEFTPAGTIAGATIDWYLLEKSRVTSRSENERSFHVFYQLLKGARKDLKRDLLLTGGPEDYDYLKHSRLNIEGVDDHAEWRALEHALDVVGFTPEEQFDLFRVIAAILHIGNIAVTEDRSQQAYIRDNSSLEKVCHLLGLPVAELTKALLRPRVKAGREWVTQARNKKQVEDEMGSLCKSIYEKSFGALVDRINKALDRPMAKSTFIGVLDIAGFEIFETNGFEQLCINYTNEKLQQFFNHHMFVLEQEEYARENIDWSFVNFGLDLQPTIDLIESTSPVGILSCLDEECIMPKASDATFTEKLNQLNAKQQQNRTSVLGKDGTLASVSPTSKYAPARFAMGFTISHYAGKVEYRTDGWLDKNKDPLNANITSVLANSTDRYVASLFDEFKDDDLNEAGLDASTNGVRPPVKRRVAKKGAFRTVAQRHKEQLSILMTQLKDTQPHFVRCIVPNEEKKPGKVNVPLVLDQLRCNGVLEGIRIARLGYPNRLPFVEFKQRYEVLTPGIIPKGYMDGRKACQRITEALELDSATYRIGLNKIFFKAGILAELEEKRDELLYDLFSRLQAGCRRVIGQRRLRKQLNRDAAVRTIQRNAQIYLELKNWPWWMLYTKLRPLLAATRSDEELRRKDRELALVQERAQRDSEEKARLEKLRLSLETEKRKVQEALESERALNVDKDALLARSKAREAELEEEMAQMQADLDTLDNQLERALNAQASSEKRYKELKAAYEEITRNVARLEAESATLRSREHSATGELEKHQQQVNALASERDLLAKKADDLKRKLSERDEDHLRVRKRLEQTQAELQGKLSIIVKEKDSQSTRAGALEAQQRHSEAHIAELKRNIADTEKEMKGKDNEIASLNSRITSLSKQKDAAGSEASAARIQVEALNKQILDLKADVNRLSSAKVKVEQEMDKLAQVVAAKTSEDTKQREMAALKEREIAELRTQIVAVAQQLQSTAAASNDKIAALSLELESSRADLTKTDTALQGAVKQLDEYEGRLATTQQSLKSAESALKTSESNLADIRTQHAEVQKRLREATAECERLEKETSAARAKMQVLEDRALQAEREHASKERELNSLGDKLEAEMTQRMKLEKSSRALGNEVESLQLKIVEQDQYIKGLRKELQEKEGELAKSLSLQDKTIVEHVHVLEEAKRYTDKQLAEAQARLASMTTYSRTLEKTKARLQAELEDLTVQNDRERLDERSVEKQLRKLEEQVEKSNKRLEQEERMRQVAEQEATRLKAELARLRAAPSSSSLPTSKSSTLERSRSAFENIAPPDSAEFGLVNGVQVNHPSSNTLAALSNGGAAGKRYDPSTRNRILRDLTESHKELEAGMRATLSGLSNNNSNVSTNNARPLGRQ